jgi:hypothetical protein
MPFSIRPYRRLSLFYISGFWLLITLLVLSSGPAYAEWLMFGKDIQLGAVMYVDPDIIHREGDLAKMWSLLDYKKVQADSAGSSLSTKQQIEYNCTEERMRVLAMMVFSGNMGSGTLVNINPAEGMWIPFTRYYRLRYAEACVRRSDRARLERLGADYRDGTAGSEGDDALEGSFKKDAPTPSPCLPGCPGP